MRSPFEPMSQIHVDIKFVMLKTVFLITFASSRRRSEIHALSVSPTHLRFAPDYTQVTLCTDPTFLVKNLLPSHVGESYYSSVFIFCYFHSL